jgi:hypothetical protein
VNMSEQERDEVKDPKISKTGGGVVNSSVGAAAPLAPMTTDDGEDQQVQVSGTRVGETSEMAVGPKSNFYTASHMMNTIQDTMSKVMGDQGPAANGSKDGAAFQGVELHRRLPDGRTVPLDETGMKVTDVRMKLKQVRRYKRIHESDVVFLKAAIRNTHLQRLYCIVLKQLQLPYERQRIA